MTSLEVDALRIALRTLAWTAGRAEERLAEGDFAGGWHALEGLAGLAAHPQATGLQTLFLARPETFTSEGLRTLAQLAHEGAREARRLARLNEGDDLGRHYDERARAFETLIALALARGELPGAIQ